MSKPIIIILKRKSVRTFLFLSAAVYLLLLAYILFVNVSGTDRSHAFQNPDDHFLPFQSTRAMINNAWAEGFGGLKTTMLFKNTLGNIALFLPVGLVMPLISARYHNALRVGLFAFLLSLGAEVLQFLLHLGVFDVDDIIYNTIGGLLGYGFIYLARKVFLHAAH